MNGTVLNKTELAAWRALLARPDGKALWLSAGLYLLAALIIPFAGIAELSMLFITACIVFLLTATHAFRTILVPGIPALVLFSLSGSMGIPAVCPGFIQGDKLHTTEEYVVKDSLAPGLAAALKLTDSYL